MLLYSSRRFKNVGVKTLLKFGPRTVPMMAEHNHISSLNMNVINSRSLLTMDDDIGNQYATVLVSRSLYHLIFDGVGCPLQV